MVSDRGHHDTELARLSATGKPPPPMASHDRHRLLRQWALITPQMGLSRVGCKRSTLLDNRGSFGDKGRQKRRDSAAMGAGGG
ncbi:hypothetical protein CF129_00805 [Aeromonas dhakensis]|nr:hypothetical protein CF129_00805 [Aeromonas dhakensis]